MVERDEFVMTETDRALLCHVGDLLCALPLEHVAETMRPLQIEAMPGTPDFVAGMSIVRGQPIPIIELAPLFEAEPGAAARLVIVRSGDRRIGLLVDDVVGVRPIAPSVFRRLPALLRDASRHAVAEIGALDGELMVALSAARVVPEEVFREVERRAAAS